MKVIDSLGNSATATITVGAGVTLLPATASVPPQGTVMLSASGGSGAGFVFSISVSHSGASVDGSGKYTAGPTGSVVDVVTVADSVGNSATSSITVGPVVTILASGTSAPPRGPLTFTPAGGSGVGYSFTLSTNASGATINGATGAYTAGAKPDVTDVILLTDSLGNSAAANVAVGDGVSVTPPAPVRAAARLPEPGRHRGQRPRDSSSPSPPTSRAGPSTRRRAPTRPAAWGAPWIW